MNKQLSQKRFVLFLALVAAVALATGIRDSVVSNYVKEVYAADSFRRGVVEAVCEVPGILCTVIIALLSFLGDFRLSLLSQVVALAGFVLLGLFTPAFAVVLLFLFIQSVGMHVFMPLSDSMCMALSEQDQIGRRMGQYMSVKSACCLAAALLVFFGFRSGILSFKTEIKWIFIIAAVFTLVAVFLGFALVGSAKGLGFGKKPRLVFRKRYKYYYLLTVLHGVQKQIALVYGTWAVIEILGKGTDTVALLLIVSYFLCMFFMNYVGKCMDRYGIKKMMYVDALTFIFVYLLYGLVIWGITAKVLPGSGWAGILVYVLFVADRLSMQIGVVKSIYLKSIATDPEEVTLTLSTGTSLDHCAAIVASLACGVIWEQWGSQWVFFLAAIFSLGNLFVAWKIRPEEETKK